MHKYDTSYCAHFLQGTLFPSFHISRSDKLKPQSSPDQLSSASPILTSTPLIHTKSTISTSTMPIGIAKKLMTEEETEKSEPTGRRRTGSASLGPPAVPQTPHSRAFTRNRALQDGTTAISEGLPTSTKRASSREKNASPKQNTHTSELQKHHDNHSTRPEEDTSEATEGFEYYDESRANITTAIPISARLAHLSNPTPRRGEGDLSTVPEVDESDFSNQVNANYLLLPLNIILLLFNKHIKDLTVA